MTDEPMVHDPVMAYEDGVYHLFSTGQGLQHAVSTDLKTWTVKAAPVMTVIPQWTHDSVPGFRQHVWAPDIIRYRDRWWMTYSCSTFGKNTSAIGLLSTRSLNSRPIWNDEGCVVRSRRGTDRWNAIDPNVIIDREGQPWMAFGSFWDGIQLVRLDSTLHLDTLYQRRTIARRYTGKRENPVEAPFLFRHGDYYYLFVSWDYCCRGAQSSYKVVVGRSRNIEGPYLDSHGVDMALGGGTMVIEGDKQEFEAAGHCAAYHFNGQDYFLCHGYSVKWDGVSVLVLRRMEWDSDGWPVLKRF